MDLGEPKRTIIVKPASIPVPQRRIPDREPSPVEVPDEEYVETEK